jgi:16S rRNA (cytosine1402-N4)-methyltransferase
MAEIAHTPVMLEEVLSFLVPSRDDALMLDCTLGEGGHAAAFLARYPRLRCVGLDADPSIQAKAKGRLAPYGDRVEFRLGYYDELLARWDSLDIRSGQDSGSSRSELQNRTSEGESIKPSLVLFDLGVSMYHFAESGRGFGYGRDEGLDMRLSPEAPRSAADILLREREDEIARIIYEYGEERLSRRIAAAIVEARRSGAVATSGRLAKIVWDAVPPSYRHGKVHPATRTFQALRIAVNDELGRAERGIRAAAALLAPGGLIAVISFHSLEDRIAKNVFRELAGRAPRDASDPGRTPAAPALELVTKKPVEPSAAEVAANPASRSAKLRVARRLPDSVERAAS